MLYEGGAKPPIRFIPDDLIDRLDATITEGRREEALEEFMLKAAGVTPSELELLKRQSAWAGRVAAAYTLPRELRATNDYATDPEALARLGTPTVLLVGGESAPQRRQAMEVMAAGLPHARLVELAGQRHAAHQAAPQQFADAVRQILQLAGG